MTKAQYFLFQLHFILMLLANPLVAQNNDNNINQNGETNQAQDTSSPMESQNSTGDLFDPFEFLNNASLSDCAPLMWNDTTQITLSTSADGVRCIAVPTLPCPPLNNETIECENDKLSLVKLTIVPNILGRYEIMHKPPSSYFDDDLREESDFPDAMGYGWNSPSEGLVYCVTSGTWIVFVDFVEKSRLIIQVEPVAADEACNSHILGYDGYDGYTPVDPSEEEQGFEESPSAVVWSSQRYFLRADFFGYSVDGEHFITTMENATSVEITGDPGGDDYMTIEITWVSLSGTEKRFFGYFESDGNTWRLFEARVYNNNEDWVTFLLGDQEMRGIRDVCFQRDEVTLTTKTVAGGNGMIVFQNLTLAVFLPWSDTDIMEACMAPQSIREETSRAVVWSTPRYFLQARHFEYTITGQSTETMVGARNIFIGGDPGWENYLTIEIEWLSNADGVQKRFFAYFNANATHWNMFEARVKNSEADKWESFEGLEHVVAGEEGSCLTSETLIITNDQGSEIRFENLVLAVFLPWDDNVTNEGQTRPPAVMEARSASFGGFDFEASCQVLLHGRPITETPDHSGASSSAVVGDDDTAGGVVVAGKTKDGDQERESEFLERASSAAPSPVIVAAAATIVATACLAMFEAQ